MKTETLTCPPSPYVIERANKAQSLLERGFKALEKGDIEKAERLWAKRDRMLGKVTRRK